MTKEDLKKIAMRYAHDELKDNHAPVEEIVAAAFLNGIDYAGHHPNWISVEDELPEVCVEVLTTTPHGTQRVGFYEDGWWLANFIDLVRMGSITHWMPLPTQPKKGGEQ